MNLDQYVKAGAALENVQGQPAGNFHPPTPPQTSAESILTRLTDIRTKMHETCSSLCLTADKIVGSAPTPLSTTAGEPIKNGRIPTSFLESVQQMIADLENLCVETDEHLRRLNRSF